MFLAVAPALVVWVTVPSLVLALTIATALLAAANDEDRCGAEHPASHWPVGRWRWSAEQTANARLITSIVRQRGLPPRAAVLAVATALAESGLRNLRHGDRDSLGLFQQRPSQGWGQPGMILDPTAATNQFLDHLLSLPSWAGMTAGVAEQAVQRSAHPWVYATSEPAAADLVTRYWATAPSDTTGPDVGQPMRATAFDPTNCPGDLTGPPAPARRIPDRRRMPAGYQLPTDPTARAALAYALAQVGKPYVWGATGPNAFDCSGLVQASWATAGIRIGRTTATQIHDGTPVARLDQIQPGDLLFIPGDAGSVSHPGHIGLAAGGGWVIDAYDDSHGIIIEPLSRWAPKIVAIRRLTIPGGSPELKGLQ